MANFWLLHTFYNRHTHIKCARTAADISFQSFCPFAFRCEFFLFFSLSIFADAIPYYTFVGFFSSRVVKCVSVFSSLFFVLFFPMHISDACAKRYTNPHRRCNDSFSIPFQTREAFQPVQRVRRCSDLHLLIRFR